MNIYVIIPAVDQQYQNFDQLVSDLCGNYTPQDRVSQGFMIEGEEEAVPNPYKDAVMTDLSDKIIFVAHTEFSAPANTESVIVEGELNVAKLWNAGIAYATSLGATHVVVLNEASSVNPNVISESISDNDNEIINLSDGGCFVVKPNVVADEEYRWWFADLDLFNRYNSAIVRNEWLDLVQNNRIEIDETMKSIVDSDEVTYSSKQS